MVTFAGLLHLLAIRVDLDWSHLRPVFTASDSQQKMAIMVADVTRRIPTEKRYELTLLLESLSEKEQSE
jgi:hypothetical protein